MKPCADNYTAAPTIETLKAKVITHVSLDACPTTQTIRRPHPNYPPLRLPSVLITAQFQRWLVVNTREITTLPISYFAMSSI